MNEQNLKPWPKGVSGNPGGKIKMSPEVRKLLEEIEKSAWPELLEAIKAPDTRAETKLAILKEATDRLRGKPAQEISQTITEKRPIIFDASLNETVNDEANGEATAAIPKAQ